MSSLFEPITIRNLTIRNRIWVSPMCMYSVPEHDGVPNQWHLVHYGGLAQGGFGLIMVEATAVNPEGRITPWDCGLWSKTQLDCFLDITDFVHTQDAAIGIQLNHSGRKGSRNRGFPGETKDPIPKELGGWTPLAPSPIARPEHVTPDELDLEGIQTIVDDFRKAARRARKAGFDVIEIHAAHGFLLNNFLSPLTNHRTDEYGGDFTGRIKLLLEVVDAVRRVWDGPLFVRISATEWVEGGWTLEESVKLAKQLKGHGVDLIDVSTGGNVDVEIPLEPGYQVRFAEDIKDKATVPTAAVGLITEPEHAEEIVASGAADAVFIGRAALREPFWPLRAAHELGVPKDEIPYQPQLIRGAWN